jgi:hypothetical protein
MKYVVCKNLYTLTPFLSLYKVTHNVRGFMTFYLQYIVITFSKFELIELRLNFKFSLQLLVLPNVPFSRKMQFLTFFTSAVDVVVRFWS